MLWRPSAETAPSPILTRPPDLTRSRTLPPPSLIWASSSCIRAFATVAAASSPRMHSLWLSTISMSPVSRSCRLAFICCWKASAPEASCDSRDLFVSWNPRFESERPNFPLRFFKESVLSCAFRFSSTLNASAASARCPGVDFSACRNIGRRPYDGLLPRRAAFWRRASGLTKTPRGKARGVWRRGGEGGTPADHARGAEREPDTSVTTNL